MSEYYNGFQGSDLGLPGGGDFVFLGPVQVKPEPGSLGRGLPWRYCPYLQGLLTPGVCKTSFLP